MRGDSLRDFYAKTLAVLGLGLIAAAGAMVDYWPVSGTLPAVPAAAGVRPEVPVLAQDLTREIPEPATLRVAYRPVFVQSPARFADALRVAPFVAPRPAPVVDVAPDPDPIPDYQSIVVDSELAAPLLVAAAEIAPPPAPAADSDSRPFLVGAIQRARATLKDARLFLGEKLHGVMGAFRKVSPFFNASTVLPNPF